MNDKEPELTPSVRTFADMHLRKELLQSLASLGLERPSAIQKAGIPACITGHDVILEASAGTGKTVAVSITVLNNLDLDCETYQVIHITPYRECATRTKDTYLSLGQGLKFSCLACVGGVKMKEQIEHIRKGAHILLSTPGRLLDLIHREVLDISQIQTVVLDELDDIIEYKGMLDQVHELFKYFSKNIQVVIVTSYRTKDIQTVIDCYTKEPLIIKLPPR